MLTAFVTSKKISPHDDSYALHAIVAIEIGRAHV